MALIWRLLLVATLTAVFVTIGVLTDYLRFLQTPVRLPAATTSVTVERGASLRQVAGDLTAQGILNNPYYLVALAFTRGDQGRIKAGEFELTRGMVPAQLLDRLVSGKAIEYPITLVEGWTFRQAVDAIAQDPRLGGDLAGQTDAQLMAALGQPGEHPEGRLFPDTYRFPRGTTGMDLLRRAHKRMAEVLEKEWEGRDPDLPLASPYEALILASIIEKETAVAAERPVIGGVFVRRLRQGMRLQTDPTVIYGMGERYDGNIRRADLREATPYNTYVIAGLPPTPIALAGREALRAALHPAPGDSLYFVARGDGSHVFSATLEAHNAAVRRYQLAKP